MSVATEQPQGSEANDVTSFLSTSEKHQLQTSRDEDSVRKAVDDAVIAPLVKKAKTGKTEKTGTAKSTTVKGSKAKKDTKKKVVSYDVLVDLGGGLKLRQSEIDKIARDRLSKKFSEIDKRVAQQHKLEAEKRKKLKEFQQIQEQASIHSKLSKFRESLSLHRNTVLTEHQEKVKEIEAQIKAIDKEIEGYKSKTSADIEKSIQDHEDNHEAAESKLIRDKERTKKDAENQEAAKLRSIHEHKINQKKSEIMTRVLEAKKKEYAFKLDLYELQLSQTSRAVDKNNDENDERAAVKKDLEDKIAALREDISNNDAKIAESKELELTSKKNVETAQADLEASKTSVLTLHEELEKLSNERTQRELRLQDAIAKRKAYDEEKEKKRLEAEERKRERAAERQRRAEEKQRRAEERARIAEEERLRKEEEERLRKEEEEKKRKEEEERLAKEEADRLAKEEADRLAKEEADRLAKEEADRLAKVEADRLAKVEADRLAKEEADRLAKEEADRLAKEEADRLAKEEADRLAKVEADRLAKEEADILAKEEADRLAKEEADRLAKEEADRLAKVEADRLAKEEADRLAKEEADSLAKVEADKLAKEEVEKAAQQKAVKEEAGRLPQEELEKKSQVKQKDVNEIAGTRELENNTSAIEEGKNEVETPVHDAAKVVGITPSVDSKGVSQPPADDVVEAAVESHTTLDTPKNLSITVPDSEDAGEQAPLSSPTSSTSKKLSMVEVAEIYGGSNPNTPRTRSRKSSRASSIASAETVESKSQPKKSRFFWKKNKEPTPVISSAASQRRRSGSLSRTTSITSKKSSSNIAAGVGGTAEVLAATATAAAATSVGTKKSIPSIKTPKTVSSTPAIDSGSSDVADIDAKSPKTDEAGTQPQALEGSVVTSGNEELHQETDKLDSSLASAGVSTPKDPATLTEGAKLTSTDGTEFKTQLIQGGDAPVISIHSSDPNVVLEEITAEEAKKEANVLKIDVGKHSIEEISPATVGGVLAGAGTSLVSGDISSSTSLEQNAGFDEKNTSEPVTVPTTAGEDLTPEPASNNVPVLQSREISPGLESSSGSRETTPEPGSQKPGKNARKNKKKREAAKKKKQSVEEELQKPQTSVDAIAPNAISAISTSKDVENATPVAVTPSVKEIPETAPVLTAAAGFDSKAASATSYEEPAPVEIPESQKFSVLPDVSPQSHVQEKDLKTSNVGGIAAAAAAAIPGYKEPKAVEIPTEQKFSVLPGVSTESHSNELKQSASDIIPKPIQALYQEPAPVVIPEDQKFAVAKNASPESHADEISTAKKDLTVDASNGGLLATAGAAIVGTAAAAANAALGSLKSTIGGETEESDKPTNEISTPEVKALKEKEQSAKLASSEDTPATYADSIIGAPIPEESEYEESVISKAASKDLRASKVISKDLISITEPVTEDDGELTKTDSKNGRPISSITGSNSEVPTLDPKYNKRYSAPESSTSNAVSGKSLLEEPAFIAEEPKITKEVTSEKPIEAEKVVTKDAPSISKSNRKTANGASVPSSATASPKKSSKKPSKKAETKVAAKEDKSIFKRIWGKVKSKNDEEKPTSAKKAKSTAKTPTSTSKSTKDAKSSSTKAAAKPAAESKKDVKPAGTKTTKKALPKEKTVDGDKNIVPASVDHSKPSEGGAEPKETGDKLKVGEAIEPHSSAPKTGAAVTVDDNHPISKAVSDDSYSYREVVSYDNKSEVGKSEIDRVSGKPEDILEGDEGVATVPSTPKRKGAVTGEDNQLETKPVSDNDSYSYRSVVSYEEVSATNSK